jgi:hydrogenase nickel incorporation protein HypA/HybF
MHEMVMAEQIVAELHRLAEQHRPCRLKRVTLKVGVMRQVVAELLRFALTAASKGGPADGAEWVIDPVPVRCRCQECGAEFEIVEWNYRCPKCQSGRVTPASRGDEAIIETVTLETDDPSPEPPVPGA